MKEVFVRIVIINVFFCELMFFGSGYLSRASYFYAYVECEPGAIG